MSAEEELDAKIEQLMAGTDVRQIAQGLIDLEQVIPGVTPGAIIDAMEDPEAFAAIARGDLYVTLARLRTRMAHPDISTTQLMDHAKFLSKMGKVDAPDKDGGGLYANVPMISIVLPNSGGEVRIGASPQREPEERDVTPKVSTAVLP